MRVKILVAYDGTEFHGWARQTGGLRTVQGELEDALARVVRVPVPLTVAGRTDGGVHAWGQVASGDVPDDSDLSALARSVNRMCGPSIAVRSF